MILVVLVLLAGPAFVTAVFIAEVLAGLKRAPARKTSPQPLRAVTFIVPAHDEAAILEGTLSRLLPEIEGWGQVLLVADNCTDATAAIGRQCGVRVIERNDRERRGKGFALDFAREQLRAAPPAAVIVFDADCWSDRASLKALATHALGTGRPCQSIYLIAPKKGAPPLVQLSNFAFMIKNLIRQRGLQALSGRVHLTGTGMAFPWPLFAEAPLASANIVEDVELGRALDGAGYPPQLVEDAHVWSDPSSAAGTLVQRTRWEGGFLAHAKKQAPRAIGAAIRRGDARALFSALDLCVPPLTLLALIDAAVLLVAAGVTAVFHLAGWPLLVGAGIALMAGTAVAIAWAREGRSFIGVGTLLRIPLYILWKIPLYLGLARGAPPEWLRAGR